MLFMSFGYNSYFQVTKILKQYLLLANFINEYE